MSKAAYQRIDIATLSTGVERAVSDARAASPAAVNIRLIIIPISILLCVAQSVLTLYASNVSGSIITSCLIPVMGFALLFLSVLVFNPLLRVISKPGGILNWLRPLNRPELSCLFAAMMVTAGISTFGLTEQLIPIIPTPNNPEWNKPQRGWAQVINNMRPELYISDPKAIETFRIGVNVDGDGIPIKVPRENASLWERMAYGQKIAANIPWMTWLKPLACWSVLIFASYLLFYSLAYIVLAYWTDREKLIFPIAKLPESILPDETTNWLPRIFRSGLFWGGFGLSFCILSYNTLLNTGWVSGLYAIPLGMTSQAFDQLVTGSQWFEGLSGSAAPHPMRFLIIFTAIGVAFLLPLEISFSAWFYFLVGKIVILTLVWMGYGKTAADFPADWLWNSNAVTAQGGGGLLVFSAIALFRCLRDYYHLVAGKDWGERVRVGLPVVGFVVSLAILASWLTWNHLPLFWAVIFVAVLALLTVGLMRIVAEGGIYWFQSWGGSFFHYYRAFGLGNFLSPILIGPLLPIYSVLFLDIKTFMAPNLLDGARLRSDVQASRTKFHANLVLCVLISVGVSLLFAVYLAHLRGAQQMQGWFYSSGPQWVMDLSLEATTTTTKFQPATAAWYGVGGLWVALSMFLRRSLFWFPHPIGYIMLINPLMSQLWFSFFIGWICKKLVVKYGGKSTFDTVRNVFIGLILGELIAIVLWSFLGMYYGFAGPTLNRYN